MPSPIGHALAGAAIAWTIRAPMGPPRGQTPGRTRSILAIACAALAVAPDLDLVMPQGHRMATHSIAAVALIMIVAIAVTWQVTRRIAWPIVAACTAAYASHLLLDWLAVDPTAPRGLQLLWPFSDGWFISGWDLFRGTARRNIFSEQSMRINAAAIAQEVLVLGSLAAATRAFFITKTRRSVERTKRSTSS